MKEILLELLKKNRHSTFLKNELVIGCKCGFSETITYYDFLEAGEFQIGESTSTISPFISESVYDETINVTPLRLYRKCPVCGNEIAAVFPVSLEDIISILQAQPPDPHMYW